ncbi:MAG: FAD:protein FMN transferase [Chthoniobacter sp.]|uniref:FAD:protein FMN transferase n=1 Tax=Chthoniobacter sp. TaxID=2510640 RepID=UPI0032A8A5D1
MRRILAALAAFSLTVLSSPADEALQKFVYEKAEMGLPFRISMYAKDEATAKAAAEAAFDRVAVLNSILSDYDSDSELSRLSQTSGQGKAVPVSTDLWRVLERAQQYAVRSDGAFDVTVGPLVNLWRRARHKQELPTPELIAEMKARVGYKNLRLDPEHHTAELLVPEMRLDLGAIAKNYAVDEAVAVLKQRGITRVLVGGSGDMTAGDAPPDQPGWRIEVAPLDVPGAPPPQIIYLKNRSIATSGDMFQRVEIGGKRYSHIVDPRTGIGLTDHSLVTVVASDCMAANGLTTTISVLGPERGLKFVEDTPGAAAHVVRMPDDKIQFVESSRWKDVPKAAP